MIEKSTYRIKVTGLVQGVGFRPFVYRLAKKYGLEGTVDNRNDGVLIEVNGGGSDISAFANAVGKEAPRAAVIENITVDEIPSKSFMGFRIIRSKNNIVVNEITEVSPDIAVCNDCLEDMKRQKHRLNYAFTNCTNCGPRFTIIKALPYDRPNTTMAGFAMCNECQNEYSDVENRRFHAQPVACNDCGPHYSLVTGGKTVNNIEDITSFLAEVIASGDVFAAKGLGGFNLICDAANEIAVRKLRRSKHRDGKPLAVMFRDMDAVKRYCHAGEAERKALESWRRPVVILKNANPLAESVSLGFGTTGALLPYLPFHYLLFGKTKCDALVFTSANLSGEPIIIDNDIAVNAFAAKMPVLIHNRDIHNRADDSVGFVAGDKYRLIRRSRGRVPSPVRMPFDVDGILATGAELVNTFCIGRTTQAILSQHIGDLKNAGTLDFFEESIERFCELYKFQPRLIACDLHPDYLSSQYAANTGIDILPVQHHHAHMCSAMAENGIDEQVIGVIMDGTGYGIDGNIWGGEFFTGGYNGFQRQAHFDYIPVPGGDSAVKSPWKTAVSYLYKVFGTEFSGVDIPFTANLDPVKTSLLMEMIDKNINSPLSSSAGRLFDAVAAITGVCSETSFHAEAPMRLEDAIGETVTKECYDFDFGEAIGFTKTVKGIVDDLKNGVAVSYISAKFHNTIVEVILKSALVIRQKTSIGKVVLSGGTFQNKYLCIKTEEALENAGFQVFTQNTVPANDGGISLGQLAVAAKRLM
jgi:hydrogenase maturation protein HypF